MADSSPKAPTLELPERSLALGGAPRIMGIVNVTPDSFYAPARTPGADAAVERGLALVAAGAAIVDVGGMTAQPGPPISPEEETRRVCPVVRELRARSDAVVAVDTYRAAVAEAALAAGAEIVNDHTGLSDPELAEVVARHRAALVVTHLGLAPKAEQRGRYDVEPAAIRDFLLARARLAEQRGVSSRSILVDPGLGFGKTTRSDLAALHELPALRALGYPVLLACSHKEVTAEPLGLPEPALEGTAAVVAVAAYLGVEVLRLHDLPFMARVARMGWLLGAGYAAGGVRSGANSGRKAPSR